LYVVATPIGNLGDLTPRAAQVFNECSVVCAEDTRRTRALLSHLGIQGKRLHALHAHSSERAVSQALDWVREGQKVALATDAGTPCVSDPGIELIRACHDAGLQVISVPGASAVTTAVSVSGLVDGAFTFLGFLPRGGAKRARLLNRIAESSEPSVLFEAPGRVAETLRDLAELIPERRACVARELSKLHEQVRVATLAQLASSEDEWRGECTLVIQGQSEPDEPPEIGDEAALRTEIATALRAGAGTKALADALAERLGRSRKEMYSLVLQCAEDA
jgi:16S rRNA (cytidine1402-2'-O)-methyltransferase